MTGRLWSPVIGLGVPAVALLVVVPIIGDTGVRVAGVPLLFFWVFLWIPLTSLCLWASWHFVDRHRPGPDDHPAAARTEPRA